MSIFQYILLWQDAPAPGGAGSFNLILLAAIFLVFYFFIIRPQQKSRGEQEKFVQNLKRGQKVVTQSGVHGIIADFKDTTVSLIIAPKVHITIERFAISKDVSLAAYPQGVAAESKAEESKKEEDASDAK